MRMKRITIYVNSNSICQNQRFGWHFREATPARLTGRRAREQHDEISTNPARDRPCWANSPKGSMRMRLLNPILAVLAAVIVTTAWAEDSPMPDEIAWKLLELGRVVDPAKTAALYAPLQQKEPYQGVKIERDLRYGLTDRNLLDVFMPETSSPPRPVLILVHGGAFVAGNKH